MGKRYRLVVYYGGEFMTCVKWQYTGPKSKVFEGMEVYDMTVKQVRDLVADVVADDDKLYFMKDGVTPDNGYGLLLRDSDLKELAIASNMTGVCKIHVFHSWSTATAPVCVEEEYLGGDNEELEDQYSTEECSEEEESTEGEDEGESAEEEAEEEDGAEKECKQVQQKNDVKAKRGLTRLPKLHSRFTNSGGKRHEVEFDSLGRLMGEYRSEFTSFLGDTVREHVGLRWLTWKEVPKEVKAKLWDQATNFDVSKTTKIARSWSVFDHRLGRGGYPRLKEKLVSKKEIAVDDVPTRAFMWRKGRENKDGELVDPKVKKMADYLMDIEAQIKDGIIKIVPDEDALTVVFGREQGSYLRGVGCGVTPSTYWRCPRQRTTGKDKIKILELQLENEKLLREKKDEELKNLSLQMEATNNKLNKVMAQLDSQGLLSATKLDGTPISGNGSRDSCINVTIPASKEFLTPVKSVENQVTPTADTSIMAQKVIITRRKVYISPRTTKSQDPTIVQQEKVITSGTRKKICLSQPSTISGQMPSQSNQTSTIAMKCTLYTLNLNNPVARGTAFLSDQQGQTIHGAPLQDDCYRVSVDEVVKGAAFLPYEADDMRTVEYALGLFVAWPKNHIKIIDHQEKVITSGTRKKICLSQPSTISVKSNLNYCPIAMKCTLYTLNLNNQVARGTTFLSDQQGQTIHGVPLQDDCYRVSVDEVVKGAAFLLYEADDMRTVEDALGSFVAWPKNHIKIIDHQVPTPTANGEGKEHSNGEGKEHSAAQAKKGKRCNTITGSPVTRSKAKANKADKLIRKKRKLAVV
ncbi:hypothetical protein OROMI_012270 [Orobanche minor]